ncbi:MAG: hypothetical protein M5U26_26930 [Planctomycetota bacterium]|nr:hypothetical protein [Planctomycetota bacterium]
MPSEKEEALECLTQMPDDCTLEDMLYRLYVVQRIKRGLADSKAGHKKPHAEAMKEIREWLYRLHGPQAPSKT